MTDHPSRPCKYCGTPTRAIHQVCIAHDDLLAVDPWLSMRTRSRGRGWFHRLLIVFFTRPPRPW